VTLPRPGRQAALLGLIILLVALVAAGCASSNLVPVGSGGPATASPHPPLVPASPGPDPFSLIAWLLNPIFQILFIALVWIEKLTGDIGVAIIVVTLVIRTLLVPLFRRQIVQTKRTQLLQPELKELQQRYKGDRNKLSQAQMELYKERGVNPASGCLPLLLQLPLLMVIYSVISQGLTNPDPRAMFTMFGVQLVDYTCVNGVGVPGATPDLYKPCIDTTVAWLGNLDVSRAWVLFPQIPLLGWFSLLAAISAVLQLVQSRMTMPPATGAYTDQSSKLQRQLVLFLPLLSFVYGSFLPAGLFIYWIVTTIFGIVQQYLIVGWGSMFPFLRWDPAFARNHRPRFPVEMPSHVPSGAPPKGRRPGQAPPSTVTTTPRTSAERKISAEATLRPRERGRQGRRGRRH
jgi:YidC/Oxa1 family membrane protein insertase